MSPKVLETQLRRLLPSFVGRSIDSFAKETAVAVTASTRPVFVALLGRLPGGDHRGVTDAVVLEVDGRRRGRGLAFALSVIRQFELDVDARDRRGTSPRHFDSIHRAIRNDRGGALQLARVHGALAPHHRWRAVSFLGLRESSVARARRSRRTMPPRSDRRRTPPPHHPHPHPPGPSTGTEAGDGRAPFALRPPSVDLDSLPLAAGALERDARRERGDRHLDDRDSAHHRSAPAPVHGDDRGQQVDGQVDLHGLYGRVHADEAAGRLRCNVLDTTMVTFELSRVSPDATPLVAAALGPSLDARGLRRVVAASAPDELVEALPLHGLLMALHLAYSGHQSRVTVAAHVQHAQVARAARLGAFTRRA